MTNKDVEEKAIILVLNYLKKQGIVGKRVNNCGYDIKTDNLKIEVKSRKERRTALLLNYSNIDAFKTHDDIELWAVVGVGTKTPELIKISKKILIERKTEKPVWRFNLKNCDFDESIELKSFHS